LEGQNPATRSEAVFAIAEMLAVCAGITVLFWVLNPRMLQPGMAPVVLLFSLVLGLYVIWLSPHVIHGDSLEERGLGGLKTLFIRTDNFWSATGVILPVTAVLACALVLAGLLRNPTALASVNWRRFLIKHGLYIVWATVQALFFFGYFMQRLRTLVLALPQVSARRAGSVRVSVVFLTAILFGLAHTPNPVMMLLTFLIGGLWAWYFWEHRNLIVIAASHAFLGTIIHQVLMLNMRVGPAYWEPHRFYANRVLFPFISQWMGAPQFR
jgi:membrane protease YdiL (CAAX protease family)